MKEWDLNRDGKGAGISEVKMTQQFRQVVNGLSQVGT